MKHLLIITAFTIFISGHLDAQVLDEGSCKTVYLSNGIEVKVCAAANNKDQFYYLPVSFQLSLSNEVPQISLLVYKDKMDDKISGGILHFLFQWGLTASQEKELQIKVSNEMGPSGVLMGAADISFDRDKGLQFLPPGETIAGILGASSSQPFKIPDETGKSAASFHLSAGDAKIIWNYFLRPVSGNPITLAATYSYSVAKYEGPVRGSTERKATVTGFLKDWALQAKRYNNAKIIR